jgi:hypothetical protein
VDDGAPISYLVLAAGTPVRSADGVEVGRVKSVLADDAEDIFDGVIVTTPRGDRFVEAELVDAIYERALVLSASAAEAERLPPPSENPAAMRATPDDSRPSFWQRLTGGRRRR